MLASGTASLAGSQLLMHRTGHVLCPVAEGDADRSKAASGPSCLPGMIFKVNWAAQGPVTVGEVESFPHAVFHMLSVGVIHLAARSCCRIPFGYMYLQGMCQLQIGMCSLPTELLEAPVIEQQLHMSRVVESGVKMSRYEHHARTRKGTPCRGPVKAAQRFG